MSKKIEIRGSYGMGNFIITIGDFGVYLYCSDFDKKIFIIKEISPITTLVNLERNLSRIRGVLNNPSNKELIKEKCEYSRGTMTFFSTPTMESTIEDTLSGFRVHQSERPINHPTNTEVRSPESIYMDEQQNLQNQND